MSVRVRYGNYSPAFGCCYLVPGWRCVRVMGSCFSVDDRSEGQGSKEGESATAVWKLSEAGQDVD